VDFLLPEQELGKLRLGLTVRVSTDALPGQVIEGTITAINPQVDAATRSIRIQATVTNSHEHLRPGMFAKVAVVLPARNEVLAIPATSVLYAPYGDSVFVLDDKKATEAASLLRSCVISSRGSGRGGVISSPSLRASRKARRS